MNATQYNRLNELLSEFSTVNALLEAAEGEIKIVQLAAATELLPKHAELQIKLTNIEAELRKLSDAHYDELFPEAKKRSHETPFGTVKYHKSSSLEFDDEEKVLLKIKAACQAEAARVRNLSEPPRFTEEMLIRRTEAPNLDAMGGFDDVTLALLGITRKHKDNFSVKPFAMKTDKPQKRGTKPELAGNPNN
jgi:hypothetical protein